MTNKSIIKQSFKAIPIAILLSSSLANSASYDLFENGKSNLLTPPNKNKPSFLNFDFSQQQKKNQNKKDYQEIYALIKGNKLKEAENKISALLKDNPTDAELYNLKALLAISKKEIDIAINNYQKAIDIDPKNLMAHISMAKVFFDTDNTNKATEFSKKAISINDKPTEPYFLLAEIAKNKNKLLDAEKLLLLAQKKNRGNANQEIAVAKNLGKLYLSQKQLQKTLSLAKDIYNRYPTDRSALSFLANVQLINNHKENAVQTLYTLISLDKQDTKHRQTLVNLLITNPSKKGEILKLLNEISLIAPNNLQTLIQKAVALSKLKEYSTALKVTKDIEKIDPKSDTYLAIRGEIYLAKNELNLALSAYQKAYIIKPKGKYLFLIADLLSSQEGLAEAIIFLNKELKKDNKKLATHYKIATIYQQQKKSTEAEKHYKIVLATMPDNTLALNNLAWLYYQHNDPKALAYAEQAYKLDPKSTAIADTYGSILLKNGKINQGIKILQKISKISPSDYNIQYRLADAYSTNNNYKKAKEILNRILNAEEDFSEKKSAMILFKKLNED